MLRIKPGGALRLVSGGVVSSGGVLPVSVTVSGGLVYVANAGAGGSNYTGFRLGRGGRLAPLAGSTVALPDAAQPGDVLFNGTGSKLVGTRVGTSQIDSFTVGPRGRLTAAPGSPFLAQGLGPFGSEFRPTNPSQLFVSNAHNTGTGTISAFRDRPDGSLSPIGASPFADLQTAPCWVEISHDGRFLFTVNTGAGSISRFSIAAGGRLRLLGSTPVRGTSLGAVDARLSPGGRYLYMDESATGAVASFAVHGGSLTELASSPTSLPRLRCPRGHRRHLTPIPGQAGAGGRQPGSGQPRGKAAGPQAGPAEAQRRLIPPSIHPDDHPRSPRRAWPSPGSPTRRGWEPRRRCVRPGADHRVMCHLRRYGRVGVGPCRGLSRRFYQAHDARALTCVVPEAAAGGGRIGHDHRFRQAGASSPASTWKLFWPGPPREPGGRGGLSADRARDRSGCNADHRGSLPLADPWQAYPGSAV